MGEIRLKKDIITTILVKGGILLLNFAIVVFTARLWGKEGRGFIALFIADVSFITMFSNVFTASSVSFFLSKVGASKLASIAYLWVFVVSSIAALISFFFYDFSFTLPLFIVSVALGLITFHSSLFLGAQKVSYYNLMTLLQPLLLLLFMFAINETNKEFGYYSYFIAQIISLVLVLLLARFLTCKTVGKLSASFDKKTLKNSFNFGWQVELSSILQFLNYRLTYYILGFYVGVGAVGLFSIGVTLSEAIWVFSRSISLVQYSNIIKTGDTLDARKSTESVAKYALYASFLCILVVLCLPNFVFAFTFGPEFENVKTLILFMSPGVLLIAVSNVFGNYFSAIGELKILIAKSFFGLMATLILSFLFIPKFKVEGAAIVNSSSYAVSSLFILIYYYIKKRKSTL